MKEALYTALLTFLFLSLVLGGIGWEFSLDIMKLLDTPPDVLGLADVYLRVYFLGLPFLFMYSVLSAMFNALGKSRIPLFFLIFSSLFNVGLDWILVTRYGLGVAGVAWATLIAQGIAALLSCGVLAWVLRRMPSEKPRFFASEELLPMARIALPSILQQSTVSIGMMLVQSVVNGFGSEALAGFSAAMRVEGLCVVPMSAIGNAMSPYTAQNLGACRPERIPAGLKAAFRLVFAFALLNCLLLELGSHSLSLFFLGSEGSPAAFQTAENFFHRFEDVRGRSAPGCRRYADVHHRQPGEPGSPGQPGHGPGSPFRHRLCLVCRPPGLAGQFSPFRLGIQAGKVEGKDNGSVGCVSGWKGVARFQPRLVLLSTLHRR